MLGAEYRSLVERLEDGVAVAGDHSALFDEALSVWARPGFETFMCLPRLRFEPFPYQLEAAGRVLRRTPQRRRRRSRSSAGPTLPHAPQRSRSPATRGRC